MINIMLQSELEYFLLVEFMPLRIQVEFLTNNFILSIESLATIILVEPYRRTYLLHCRVCMCLHHFCGPF